MSDRRKGSAEVSFCGCFARPKRMQRQTEEATKRRRAPSRALARSETSVFFSSLPLFSNHTCATDTELSSNSCLLTVVPSFFSFPLSLSLSTARRRERRPQRRIPAPAKPQQQQPKPESSPEPSSPSPPTRGLAPPPQRRPAARRARRRQGPRRPLGPRPLQDARVQDRGP